MGTVTATATKTIAAPPTRVLEFLHDLGARPQILTPHYSSVRTEPGNVLAFHFAAGGRERDYRLVSDLTGTTVTERDENSSFVNRWEVRPSGAGSTVTLTGSWDGASGVGGFFEGLFAPMGLKRIYSEVLTNLENTLSS